MNNTIHLTNPNPQSLRNIKLVNYDYRLNLSESELQGRILLEMKIWITILIGLFVAGCGKGEKHGHDHNPGGEGSHESADETATKKAPEETLKAGVWDTPIGFSLYFAENIDLASGLTGLVNMAPALYSDKKGEQKATMLYFVERTLVGAGEFEKAIEVVEEHYKGMSKADAIFYIAQAQADAAKPKEALETFVLAEKALSGIKSRASDNLTSRIEEQRILLGGKEQIEKHLNLEMEKTGDRNQFQLLPIANKLLKINEKELALKAFRHSSNGFGDVERKDEKEYIAQHTLCEIAEGLAAAGDVELALATVKTALETVQQIENPAKRSVAEITVLRRTGAILIKAGKNPEALVALKKGLNLAQKLNANLREEGSIEGSLKSNSLLEIATALAGAGDKRLAQETFEQAIKAAHQIKPATTFKGDDGGKVLQLKSIALAQSETGDQKGALGTLGQIAKLMQASKDVETRIESFSELASVQIQLGQTAEAKKTVESVSSAINEIKGKISFSTPMDAPVRSKPLYLIDLAKLQIKLGDKQQAMNSLTQALHLERREPNAFAKGGTYQDIALILIAEPVPDALDEDGKPVLRMKKEFSPAEKQFARRFAKVLQVK